MSPSRQRETPERVTFVVVAAILLALAGTIGYLWAQPREPAIVTVRLADDVRRAGTQVYVSGEVHNSGDETAEAGQVIAELIVEGDVDASGEQIVDFLSGGETEELVFIFEQVSPGAEPRARVASYTTP